MNPLDGVWQKVSRAEEHLSTLNLAIRQFVRQKPPPYEIALEVELESAYQFRLNIRRQPPLRFSALVGDITFNLRSALDHLAWQLSRCPTDKHIARRIEFPIFLEKSDYLKTRGGAVDKMQLMSCSARGIIETLQPYHRDDRPELKLLWILNEVNRIDKHRLLVPCYGEFMDRVEGEPVRHLGRLNHGDTVTVRTELTQGKKYEFAADVAFECPGILSTINFDRFKAIYELVRDTVIPSFERLPDLSKV